MAAKTVKADYMEQVLPEYNGNPLIEALPDIMSAEETLSCLTRTPAYNQGERNLRRNTGSIACPVCCMIIINPLRSTWISKTVYPYA